MQGAALNAMVLFCGIYVVGIKRRADAKKGRVSQKTPYQWQFSERISPNFSHTRITQVPSTTATNLDFNALNNAICLAGYEA